MEFVAATFLRRGRKRLPYRRAEGECDVVLWGWLLHVCVVWFNGGVSIILSATLFQLFNLRGYYMK